MSSLWLRVSCSGLHPRGPALGRRRHLDAPGSPGWADGAARDSNSGHQLLLPSANWLPMSVSRTTQRCTPRTVAVGSLAVTPASGSDPAKTFRVTHPGAVVQNPQLRCTNDRGGCAYGSRANERRRPPAGAVSTAHLDPTGLGPHDWYLSSRNLSMAGDLDGAVEFTVGRYDSAGVVRDSNSGHQLLLPTADWCPIFAVWTTRSWHCDPADRGVVRPADGLVQGAPAVGGAPPPPQQLQ